MASKLTNTINAIAGSASGIKCAICKTNLDGKKQVWVVGQGDTCPDCVTCCERCGEPCPPKYTDDCGFCP